MPEEFYDGKEPNVFRGDGWFAGPGIKPELQQPLYSLGDALNAGDSYVAVLLSDDGGIIRLTVPVARIKCSEDQLTGLLRERDTSSSSWVEYRKHSIGDAVDGGCGGGLVEDDVWVHSEEPADWARKATETINGVA